LSLTLVIALLLAWPLGGNVAVIHAAQDQPTGVDVTNLPVGLSDADVRELLGAALGGVSGCQPKCPVQDPNATTQILQDPVELGEAVRWQACDFAPDEQLNIAILAPSGSQVAAYSEPASTTVGSARCFTDIVPRTTFSAFGEFGQYRMSVSGRTRSQALSFGLTPASKPTVLGAKGQFELAGFAPREAVRVLGYRVGFSTDKTCSFCLSSVGTWSVTVRDDGTQLVRGTGSAVLYAVGGVSGDANSLYDEDDPRSRAWVKHGMSRDRGSIVEVVQDANLYSRPTVSSDTVAAVARSTRLRLDSYALSNEGAIWWQAMQADGTTGWIRDDVLRPANFRQARSLQTAAPLFLADRLARGIHRYATPASWSGGYLYGYTAAYLAVPAGADQWFSLSLDAGESVTVLPDIPSAAGPGCDALRLTLFGPSGQPVTPERAAISRTEISRSGLYTVRVALRPALGSCTPSFYDLAVDVDPSLQIDEGAQSGDPSNWSPPWGGSIGGTHPFVFTTAGPSDGSPESGVVWHLPTSAVAGADRSTNWSLSAFIPRHGALNGGIKRDASRAAYYWRTVGGDWQPLATIDQEASSDAYVTLGTVTNLSGDIEVGLSDNAQGSESSAWVLFSSIRASADQPVQTLVINPQP
jgi:hypothetical protein